MFYVTGDIVLASIGQPVVEESGMPDQPLVLSFDPQTVDHLGAKMYSHLPNALAELVANAYDAEATEVLITIERGGTISIVDNGHGMSRRDVAEKYLRIGRNRRTEEGGRLTENGIRTVSGKKGLGKLALFGIGKRIELSTTREGSAHSTLVTLSYDDMKSSTGEYRPVEAQGRVTRELHGTRVRLAELKRTTPIDAAEVAGSLSKLFNYVDANFKVRVAAADGTRHDVTRDSRLASIDVEFEWNFPDSFRPGGLDGYAVDHGITGKIVSSKKPLRHGMRGITVFVNGRLANEPEFFGASESSFAFSYLTGYLNADYLDELEPDVIATDRRAIDWDTDETLALRTQLQSIVQWLGQDWRARRAELRRKRNDDELGGSTDEWVESIRSSEKTAVRELVSTIESDEIDMTVDQQGQILKLIQKAVPPHAEYVWRHLHPEIRDATESYYIAQDYYTAIQEAIKRFVGETRARSGVDSAQASQIVANAFGEVGKLKVFDKYMASSAFASTTARNVEEGQKHVAMGIVSGFRNVLAHEEVQKLHSTGAITHDDCLDALSIVSHLMRRLTDATPAGDQV